MHILKRKKSLYNTASNYNIGKSKSLEDIKKIKKQLFNNASIHIFAFLKGIDMSMPIEKDKTLKFEFKNQNLIIIISDR